MQKFSNLIPSLSFSLKPDMFGWYVYLLQLNKSTYIYKERSVKAIFLDKYAVLYQVLKVFHLKTIKHLFHFVGLKNMLKSIQLV